MDENRPLFILAGNGPYDNRGCEAIVRGTTKILRESFENPRFICLSHFQSDEQYRRQCLQEIDNDIIHLTSHRLSKRKVIHNFWKPDTWSHVYRHFFKPEKIAYQVYREMLPQLDDATAVLSVGGDNYSLDYGIPTLFTSLDDLVLEREKPLAIWGASIGPFDRMPDYEKYMSHHLQKVTGIFARESSTMDYLKSIDVAENVYPVADPAFLMDPVQPERAEDIISIDEDAIGINLSPLMAKYVTGGDLEDWVKKSASIIENIALRTEMPIYLIPHVTNPNSNDYEFMKRALSLIPNNQNDITLIPPEYSAAETKWIIGQLSLFAGARTHSTIASLSSGIPTISFAYSIKAQGINRDLFGHTEYCINPMDLDNETILKKITNATDNATEIKVDLKEIVPKIQRKAMDAGKILKTPKEVC